jgi:hypothetical protein
MRFVHHCFELTLGCLLLACSSTPASTTTITRPELVAVDPADFLGMVPCGDAAELADGGVTGDKVYSYVATLFDVTTTSDGGTTPEYGFPLPSSPATSCRFPVTFSFVTAGHRYRAEIDGYDRLPQSSAEDMDPTHLKAVSLGGRVQEDGSGHVAPRWRAACSGYPPTLDLDAGADAGDAGTDAGNVGDAAPPGVISYDTLTSTVHNCPGGLQPLK